MKTLIQWLARLLLVAAIGAGGWFVWSQQQPSGLGEAFASGNGRIEATEIDVATKLAGRVVEIKSNDGDFVTVGQVLAQMDMEVLKAQLAEAQAQVSKARNAERTAAAMVALR
jgi:HlyD family secretion protein